MKDKFPEIFKNKIDNIKNKVQKEYYYKNDQKEVQDDRKSKISSISQEKDYKLDIINKINYILSRPDFVYQADVNIMYKNGENINEKVVGIKDNYLLTLEGKKIYIDDIYDIK